MVRSVRSRQEEEEDEDDEEEDPLERTRDASYHKVNLDGGRKPGAHRSKHSETEQRRRSKINERFQILRDLIPQNDQKRDKASFLLEVIQYIQFLHEKLQIHEGSCQGWSQDPSELMSWRNHCGPADNVMDLTELMGNGSSQENNTAVKPAIYRHRSVESDLREPVSYKALEDLAVAVDQTLYTNTQLQNSAHGGLPFLHQALVSNSELLDPQLLSQFRQTKPCTIESSVPSYSSNEDLKHDNEEAMISDAYSQGLLNTLSEALRSSGVDLTEARISVQLDVERRASIRPDKTISSAKDDQNRLHVKSRTDNDIRSSYEAADRFHKRPRTEHMI